MYKYLPVLGLMVLLQACTKPIQKPGCPATNQACTALFATIGIKFTDKDGNAVTVKNLTVINLRTDSVITGAGNIESGLLPGVYTIATDSNKDEFSTEGDDVQVTATDSLTRQTKTTAFKIAGGCSCHVAKLSGPDQVVFD